jgi:DNA replication and repair protein RecF
LAPPASEEFEALAAHGLACTYARNGWSDSDLETAFRAPIEERRHDELARRSSLVGPHRDDVDLAVRGLGARAFASHGEAWAAALCLRLGLATAVEREIGEPPILLVDDPFSALDPHRRDLIGERLASRGGQVVISVAAVSLITEAAHATWDVRAGTVTPRVA